MTTYTKAIIEKNQRYIIKCFGGKRAFYEDVKYRMEDSRLGVWRAVYELFCSDGYGAVYYDDMFAYLKRTIPDFNEESYFYKRTGQMRKDRVAEVYCGMLATAGSKLFEKIRKEHPDW